MPRLAQFAHLTALTALLIAALSSPCLAQPMLSCGLTNQPAATLLLPYFEVDIMNPAGRGTLFSVGNAGAEPALAHATLWTNWGHPVQSFDFFVPAGGVHSFNVRNLLDGHLPKTSHPAPFSSGSFPSCAITVTQPPVDSARLKSLLTGHPDPTDGLCYSTAVEEGRLATGYITVDVVQDCSGAAFVTPNDDGYFGDCASGLASNDNLLWGDFFLVDPEEDSAQGEKLVSLVADDDRFGPADVCVDPPCGSRNDNTFMSPGGNRMPLAQAYESRFLRGGGFDGGTELVVWVDGSTGPLVCGETPDSETTFVKTEFRNEAGEALGIHNLENLGHAFRVAVGGDDLPVTANFGCVELSAHHAFDSTSYIQDRQLWVMPLVSGSGRYSVGLNTVPVKDFCF